MKGGVYVKEVWLRQKYASTPERVYACALGQNARAERAGASAHARPWRAYSYKSGRWCDLHVQVRAVDVVVVVVAALPRGRTPAHAGRLLGVAH